MTLDEFRLLTQNAVAALIAETQTHIDIDWHGQTLLACRYDYSNLSPGHLMPGRLIPMEAIAEDVYKDGGVPSDICISVKRCSDTELEVAFLVGMVFVKEFDNLEGYRRSVPFYPYSLRFPQFPLEWAIRDAKGQIDTALSVATNGRYPLPEFGRRHTREEMRERIIWWNKGMPKKLPTDASEGSAK